jgi:hypothetical protein
MILRTIRDVEIELRKLLAAIEELKAKKVIASGVNTEQVLALINNRIKDVKSTGQEPTKFQPEDIDSANHSGTIIHHLVHNFLADVLFAGDVEFTGTVTGISGSGGNPFQFIQIKQIPVVPGEWRIGNESNNLTLLTSYTDGTNFFDLEFLAKPNLVNTQIFFDGLLGDIGRRLKKASVFDLSVLPSTGPLPVIGYVLKAKDANGNVEWGPSGASGVSQAFSSSNQGYGTAGVYSDVLGCSLLITTPGAHIITASVVTQFVVNDSELHIRAVHNQAGSFFAMTGEIILAKVTSEPGVTITSAYSWFLTVATVPCTVKLEKMKVGTGTSSIFIESNILAARLG